MDNPRLTEEQRAKVEAFYAKWNARAYLARHFPALLRKMYSAGYQAEEIDSLVAEAVCMSARCHDETRGALFSSYALTSVINIMRRQLDKQKRKVVLTMATDMQRDDDSQENLFTDESDKECDKSNEVCPFKEINRRLNRLKERERDVVEHHYGVNDKPRMSVKQMMARHKIGRQRYYQILYRAIAKMRDW